MYNMNEHEDHPIQMLIGNDNGGYMRLAKQNMITSKLIEHGDMFFLFRPKIDATKEI
jgi:hypothetical protein